MRSLLALLSIPMIGALSFGCATTAGSASGDRVVVAVDPQTQTRASEVEVTEMIVPPVVQEPAPARRRLSQTVTLGQGTSEAVYATPPAPQGHPGTGGQNVTVNNNVTVVQQPPTYYGGYGGYGGYGRSGYGAASTSRDGFGRGSSTGQAWAPSGWEGAGRTAAPGQTPGVGGNFAPAPSFGPRSMR